MLRRNYTASPAPLPRIGPAMNVAHVDAGHGRYSLGAAALPNDVGGCIAHAADIAIIASQAQARNATIAPDQNCVLRNTGAMNSAALISWIRETLDEKGIPAKDLAPAFGGDPTKVSKVLNGKRQLKASEIAPIINILGTSPPLSVLPVPDQREAASGRRKINIAEKFDRLDPRRQEVVERMLDLLLSESDDSKS